MEIDASYVSGWSRANRCFKFIRVIQLYLLQDTQMNLHARIADGTLRRTASCAWLSQQCTSLETGCSAFTEEGRKTCAVTSNDRSTEQLRSGYSLKKEARLNSSKCAIGDRDPNRAQDCEVRCEHGDAIVELLDTHCKFSISNYNSASTICNC